MPKIITFLATIFLLLVINACGSTPSGDNDRQTDVDKKQALDKSTFGPLVGTLDRARSVDQLQQGRKAALDVSIEGSEGR